MKITIYELLGMIKDGKAPKKFIYDNQLFILDEEDNVYRSHLGNRFGAMYQLDIKLNDEIEILEDTSKEEKKIPEKICTNRIINTKDILEFEMVQNKINAEYTYAINSIIDYLKNKGDE